MTDSTTSSSRPTATSSSRPTCSSPASRSTCATARSGRRTSRSSRSSRAAPASSVVCTRPGFEGWTISRYRQTGGRTPEGDPEIILEDMDLDGVDVAGDAPEPVAVRALLRRPRAVDGARACLQRLHRRAVHAVLRSASRPPRPSRSPTSTTRSPRSSGSPRPGSARSCCPRPRRSRTTRATSTRCGRRPRRTACSAFFHTQTGGVKVNDPASTTLKVVMEQATQVNQPMTEKSASKRMITQCVYSPIVPSAVHLRAHRRRRRRALPRPPLLADRVQRALAGVAGRRHGQVLGHRHRPGRRLVARELGRQPPRRRPAQRWRSSSA